ncbi:MAG TPA: exonuclease domain-containing protein [Firmicutes bacterium]|nr:exonuclease domain-containing protein [Bacillota bacterium]
MQHIFLDFEMNQIPRADRPEGSRMHSEIVEIGAVKLDKDYQQIDRFSCYVRPERAPICKKCTELTGITDETVKNAKPLAQALEEFISWIGEGQVRIYSWSNTDLRQLKTECREKGIYPNGLEPPFRRWMDFQRIYTRLMGLSNRSRLSLKNAIGTVEEDFSGSQHSAADDAQNSASLLTMVMREPEEFARRTRVITQSVNNKHLQQSTLGDMFPGLLGAFSEQK